MDSTQIIITLITVGATLIAAVVAAAWRVGRLTGGLQQSVTDGARASSDAHASIGQRIDQTRNELRADSHKLDERLSANHRELSGDVKRILERLPPPPG